MKDFLNCFGSIVAMTVLVFMVVLAFKFVDTFAKSTSNAEFTLSQGSIWIRDPKGINYVNFKVTSVWTICQECHFDSVAWQNHRKEQGF